MAEYLDLLVLPSDFRGRAFAPLCLCLVAAAVAGEEPERKQPAPKPAVTEAGGRLVVSGETVVVVADPDQPLNASSLATKTDTPLVETPRSVSVVDRRTLDDLQAINLTQANDYTLGFSNEDERGPGFDRGFRVGFTTCVATACAPTAGASASRRRSSGSSTSAVPRRFSTATAARAVS